MVSILQFVFSNVWPKHKYLKWSIRRLWQTNMSY